MPELSWPAVGQACGPRRAASNAVSCATATGQGGPGPAVGSEWPAANDQVTPQYDLLVRCAAAELVRTGEGNYELPPPTAGETAASSRSNGAAWGKAGSGEFEGNASRLLHHPSNRIGTAFLCL